MDFAAAPEPTGGPPVSTFAMPCALPGPQCTDIYIVAHEDDDLLFMNPDIVNSIDAGNHVVAIHLTAGDLRGGQAARLVDHPSAQQYWLDRERGSLNAFAFMATDEGATAYEPGTTISAKWTAQTLDLAGVQLTEYDLVQDAQTVSLVYLRLSDLQLENAWLNKPGHGGQLGDPGDGTALPLAAGAVQTVPCSGCPLGTDLPRQTITRDQLDEVLQGLIARFSENASQSSVSFQDASGLYIDTFGTAAPCNPHDSDHGACGYR
ncbi:MAG: PIG-L family deacetylase, partial [Deltaproteobacteria bacterium]|nr:PIG-L family deacetylase [Deltaproteobacteria bacterium]